MEITLTTVDTTQVIDNQALVTQMMDSYCDDLRTTWITGGHMTNDGFQPAEVENVRLYIVRRLDDTGVKQPWVVVSRYDDGAEKDIIVIGRDKRILASFGFSRSFINSVLLYVLQERPNWFE